MGLRDCSQVCFYFLVLILSLSCGGGKSSPSQVSPKNDEDPVEEYSWDRQTSLNDQDPIEYRWDEEKKRCQNQAGEAGYNLNRLVQCGKLESVDLSYSDVLDQDLRGLQLINVKADHVRFNGSDLRHAKFLAILTGSQLQGSDLRATDFSNLNPDYTRFSRLGLKGARINHQTRSFPRSLKELEGFGAKFESAFPHLNFEDLTGGEGEALSFVFDRSFTESQKQLLQDDLIYLSQMKLDLPSGTLYQKMFGQGDSSQVLSYLDQRIGVIHNRTAEHDKMTGVTRSASNGFLKYLFETINSYSSRMNSFRNGLHEYFNDRASTAALLKYSESRDQFNGQRLSVKRSAEAPIHIYARHVDLDSEAVAGRLTVLVHEARHSDCDISPALNQGFADFFSRHEELYSRASSLAQKMPKQFKSGRGLKPEQKKAEVELFDISLEFRDLQQGLATLQDAWKRSGVDAKCSYDHVDCPMDLPNKDYRGAQEACDKIPWGAYATAALFAQGMGEHCANCKELDKQAAIAAFVDSRSRLLYDWSSLSDGSLGEPSLRGFE